MRLAAAEILDIKVLTIVLENTNGKQTEFLYV